MARAKVIRQEVRQRETVEMDMTETQGDPAVVFKVVSDRWKAGWTPVTMTVVFEKQSGGFVLPAVVTGRAKRKRTRVSAL